MREVFKIKYQVIKQSDVSEEYIYAFHTKSDNDIAVLCRKDDEFFWKSLRSTNFVWHKKYKTIEQAIDGVVNQREYNEYKGQSIVEFFNIKEFATWMYNTLNQE